jgi:gamma-glutamyl phosphate reductase
MEVTVKSLYKVTMTEYERGYGQRGMGVKFFDNEHEAREFCREYASGDEDCFFRASYIKVN